jgi:hypothetical protein
MRTWNWERYAPLAGVLAVVLWFIGAWLLDKGSPGDEATGEEVLAYLNDETNSIFAGVWIFGLGTVAFLWFVGSLRVFLRNAEGGTGRVSALVFGGGLLTAAMALGLISTAFGSAFAVDINENVTPDAALALWLAGDGFFGGLEMGLLAFMLATAVVVLRTRAFPVWHGAITLLIAIWLAIFLIGWIAMIFAFPLWLILTSVLLFLRAPAPPAGTAPAASTAIE